MHCFLPNANANGCFLCEIYRSGLKQQSPQERECISVTTFSGQPQYLFNIMNARFERFDFICSNFSFMKNMKTSFGLIFFAKLGIAMAKIIGGKLKAFDVRRNRICDWRGK